MSETPFQTFLELIEFDQHVLQLQYKLKIAQQEMYDLQDQQQKLTKEIDLAKAAVNGAQKAVDAQELQMKELDAAEKEKKIRLENVSNQKEYKSVKSEIDQIAKQQHDLEQELVTVWNRLEAAKKLWEEKKSTVQVKIEELQNAINAKDAQVNECAAEIDEQMSARPAKEKMVPQEWLEKYVLMRSSVADPVVPVTQGICSACFYKVTEPDMQQLRRNKLVQCKECYRLLYLPSAQPTD